LQRAEAERSGGSLPKDAGSVTDLLHGVEQEIERKLSLSELPAVAIPEFSGTDSFAAAKVLSQHRGRFPAGVSDGSGRLAAEKFRVLGLKLRHLRERRKLKRIVVTGTAPQEGKSLVAANLALNQARSKF